MNHSDEFEDRLNLTPRPVGRSYRWIALALGAVLGILIGVTIVNFATVSFSVESSWLVGTGVALQLAGAVLGALAGWLIADRIGERLS